MNVTIREDKETGELVLFFANYFTSEMKAENKLPKVWWLECYTRREQHGQPSRDYMRKRCRPCPGNREWEARQLADHWRLLPGGNGEPVRIVSQLRSPKGYTYTGE